MNKTNQQSFSTLIFDFDGTLADSIAMSMSIYHSLAVKYTGKNLSDKEIEGLRHMNPKEILKCLNIPWYKTPFAIHEARNLYRQKTDNIYLFEDMVSIIKNLSKRYELFIASSNSCDSISSILRKHGVNDHFKSVHGGISLFGKHTTLKKIVKHSCQKNTLSTLYIGDEVRDIHASQRIPIKVGAVTWGFNAKDVLVQHNPDFLYESPQDIVRHLLF